MNYIFVSVLVALAVIGGVYVSRRDPVVDLSQKEVQTQKQEGNETLVPQLKNNVLDQSNQGISRIPMDVFSKTNLEGLDVSHNNLEGSIQAEVRHLSKLKVLDLSHNKLSGVPAEIGQLKDLEVLDLSYNLITGLPNELANLSNLKLLDLSGNAYSKADLEVIKKGLSSTVVIKTD